VGVRVAASARVALGRNQHMLAESGEMMTTDRTAIRGRLAVGRRAHRPPWGRFKAGHRPIVAPLTATLAATVAVGVGMALARAGQRRQARRLGKRERKLGLQPGEPAADGLQRMALAQVDLTLELLRGYDSADGGRAVHETRKAIKRLRALLRLLRGRLGKEAYARENAALCQTAQLLAGARDAEVMLATLEQLMERHPRKLGRRKGVRRLRRRLQLERDRMSAQTIGEAATRAQALAELTAFRTQVAAWSLPDRPGIELARPGLRRLYEQGRRRGRRAVRKDGEMAAMHAWRKRVKELRYAAEMLEREQSPVSAKHGKGAKRGTHAGHGKRAKRDRASARLHRVAKRADRLGEALGEDHDLAVLCEWIRTESKRSSGKHARAQRSEPIDRATRKALLKAIARRRKQLYRQTVREGGRLYKRSPERFLRRLG
jgi:CHAD domain-containing protein